MSREPTLTTTSYAILGLLAVKSWTTHELVQQVDRSLRRIWPRAQSRLYEEPKKLVAHGLARAEDDPVGRRRRTRYTITRRGRTVLAAWL
jgi:PadR family transcriptional regulator, regulatory protein AphA